MSFHKATYGGKNVLDKVRAMYKAGKRVFHPPSTPTVKPFICTGAKSRPLKQFVKPVAKTPKPVVPVVAPVRTFKPPANLNTPYRQ